MRLSTSSTSKTCWIFIDQDTPDNRGQCAALARSLGFRAQFYAVNGLKKHWLNWVPYRWLHPKPQRYDTSPSLDENIAVPEVIISCGRISERLALAYKTKTDVKLFSVGKANFPNNFHKIILWPYETADHDHEVGLKSILHSITPEALSHGKQTHYRTLDKFPTPRIAVLIGGHSNVLAYDQGLAHQIAKSIRELYQKQKGSFFIYTGLNPDHPFLGHLKKFLFNIPFAINDSIYDNPYLGYLAMADGILAYTDSISLICEAAATDKPLYILNQKNGPSEYENFFKTLYAQNYARAFDGAIDLNWSSKILNSASLAGKIQT